MSDFESADFNDELLSAYLDDELAPEERARVEVRLAADPQSRQLLDELRAVSRVMKELPPATLGTDLRDSVLRRAERAMLVSGGRTPAGGLNDVDRRIPFGRSKRAWFWAGAAIAAGLMLMVFEREPMRDQNLPAEVARNDRDALVPKKPLPALTMRALESRQEAAPDDELESETVEVDAAPPAVVSTPPSAASPQLDAVAPPASGGLGGASFDAGDSLADAAGNDLVVVHVNVSPEALANRVFDAVLVKHQIAVDELPNEKAESSAAADVDAVLVEAAPAQIEACLAEMKQDSGNYLSIDVDDRFAGEQRARSAKQPAEDLKRYNRGQVPQQQLALAPNNNLYYQTNRGQMVIDLGQIAQGEGELAQREGDRQSLSEASPDDVALGRAKRVAPLSTVEGHLAKEDSARALGYTESTGYGAAAAGRAAQLYGEPKQNLARRAVQKLAAKADLLQVLFVLQADEVPAAAPASSPASDNSVR